MLEPPSGRAAAVPETIRRVFSLAQDVGWELALTSVFPENICDERQAEFRSIWEIPPESTILVIADNWGTVAHALRKVFSEVTVVDDVLERAQFIDLRLRQLRLPITTICANYLRMPLASEQFDAVVLNEELQRQAVGPQSSLLSSQLSFLRAAHRLLKPRGMVCARIENRFGWHKARRRARTNHDYRALHSLRTYRNLFRDAGFSNIRMYHSWNGSDTSFLLPLHNRRALMYFAQLRQCTRVKRWAYYLAARLGLWQCLAPHAIVIAGKA